MRRAVRRHGLVSGPPPGHVSLPLRRVEFGRRHAATLPAATTSRQDVIRAARTIARRKRPGAFSWDLGSRGAVQPQLIRTGGVASTGVAAEP